MVFIDDNPAEISLVKQMIPEVKSLLLPSASEQITDFVDSIPLFEKRRVIDSDRNKTKQYNDNRKRVGLKERALKLDDYLRSLGTNVSLRPVEPGDLPRIHQLFTKTNQFNLTTIRNSLKDIESLLENEGVDLWCYSVDDTFGDLGLVGLLLVRRHQNSAEVDSFIMSCRTMGRGVEIAILNWLKRHYILQLGYNSIIAKYIATNKNLPVKDLYQQQGFVLREESDNEFVYELTSENSVLANCDWINFTSKV
jgi:FkbH-like protein